MENDSQKKVAKYSILKVSMGLKTGLSLKKQSQNTWFTIPVSSTAKATKVGLKILIWITTKMNVIMTIMKPFSSVITGDR